MLQLLSNFDTVDNVLPDRSFTLNLLGIPISRRGLDEALRHCANRAKERSGGYVCFVNVHTVTEAQDSPRLAEALWNATLALADGMPLVWVSKLRGQPVESRVCGPDFMERFLKEHPTIPQGFIGGSPGQAETLASRLGGRPACYSPPMRVFSEDNAIEDWRTFLSLKPDTAPPAVVWVGLGAPKQELWMRAVSVIAPETLFFGVGAAFDFLAGTKRRAPAWMRKAGLEWSYRLFQEPARLWKRYGKTNLKFISLLFGEAIHGRIH